MPGSQKAVNPANGVLVEPYFKLLVLLVAAVKDLQARVKELEG